MSSEDQGAGPAPARPVYAQGQHAVAPAPEQRLVPRYEDEDQLYIRRMDRPHDQTTLAEADLVQPFVRLGEFILENFPRGRERTQALGQLLAARNHAMAAFRKG